MDIRLLPTSWRLLATLPLRAHAHPQRLPHPATTEGIAKAGREGPQAPLPLALRSAWNAHGHDHPHTRWLDLAASVFTHSPEALMILSPEATIIDVNRAFTDMTGWTREETIGRHLAALDIAGMDSSCWDQVRQDLAGHGYWIGEVSAAPCGRPPYVGLIRISAVPEHAGAHHHLIASLSDITRFKQEQQALEQKAYHDALTGLPNRLLFDDRLTQAMAQARRRQDLMALAYIDLDGFKAVNDRHGHAVGDALLVEVVHRLKNELREGDTLCRVGGDEFVAILADLTDMGQCAGILRRLINAAAEPVSIRNEEIRVSASIGVTLFPFDQGDAATLLAHADQAMYLAKQGGKNRYRVFDPLALAPVDLHAYASGGTASNS